MKVVAKDDHYFWIVDTETQDVELLGDVDSFAINNKIELGIYRVTDRVISPRCHKKELSIIEEVGYGD